MGKKIAFFDFDGTITTKDTLLELIRFNKGAFHLYLGFLLNSPFVLGYKLKLLSNQAAKERILRYFFGGQSLQAFNAICDTFAKEQLPSFLWGKALQEIEKLKAAGVEITIVSASPENWIRQWAETMEVQLIATRLKVKEGKLTGRIHEKNCYGDEKARRIREVSDLGSYDEIYAYGDTRGDLPMLRLANFPFYKPFR
jgi:HAD superfamily hydrolase (TIGR01490 family)